MANIAPASDKVGIYSNALADYAETTPFFLAKSVIKAGTGINNAVDASTGTITVTFNTAWADARYVLTTNVAAAIPPTVLKTLLNALLDSLPGDPFTPTVLPSGSWWNNNGVLNRVP